MPASSTCTGQGVMCGGLAATCTLHGCAAMTACTGSHPPCGLYAGLGGVCASHGCAPVAAQCTGQHLPCSAIDVASCESHGCFLSLSCGGSPTPCTSRTPSNCALGDGCMLVSNGSMCIGMALSCTDPDRRMCNGGCSTSALCDDGIISQHGCADDGPSTCSEGGCTYVEEDCTGTPHACGSHSTAMCPGGPGGSGCSVATVCTGMADTCASHATDAQLCDQHPGCVAVLTVPSCEAPTQGECEQKIDDACPAGCICPDRN